MALPSFFPHIIALLPRTEIKTAIIDELWLFTMDGLPIVSLLQGGNVSIKGGSSIDPTLLGALLSAIKTVSQHLIKDGELNAFSVGSYKYSLVNCMKDHIMVVGRSTVSVKDKDLKKLFITIIGFFEGMYTLEEITNWNGDITLFNNYRDKLELYFKMSDL